MHSFPRGTCAVATVAPAFAATVLAGLCAHSAIAADWGDWQPVPDQIQAAVDVRLQRDFDDDRKPETHFQFRNRYGQKVTVGYVVQGEDTHHSPTQIEGTVTLDPGDQRLSREQLRLQTTACPTVTGIAFARIGFAGIPPKPTAAGSRWESPATHEIERDLEAAEAVVKAAEADKMQSEDLLFRVQRSAERGTPLVLSEGQPINTVMATDDVAKAQMRVRTAKATEENARRALEVLRVRLETSRKDDEDAMAIRKNLAARLAPTKQWADAGDWVRVEAALHAALVDPGVVIPDGDRAILQLNLGLSDLHLHRQSDALVAFTEACRLAPLNGACRCELGAALLAAGRLDDGADALNEAVRLCPNDAAYRYNLGLAREQQGRVKDARAAYQEALRIDPTDTASQNRLKMLTSAP